jgi:hypothetical protein
MRTIDTLVIHHSASRSGDVPTFRAEHIERLGARDIGYHNVIGNEHGLPDGHIAAGRPHDQEGAGVFGNNRGKLHVCLVGDFEKPDPGFTGPPSRAQFYALGHWLHVNGRRYGVTNYCRVVGHREITIPGHGTDCPGTEMPLREIRLWYQANIGRETPAQSLDAFLASLKIPMREL